MKLSCSLFTAGVFFIGSLVSPIRAQDQGQGQGQSNRPDGKGDRAHDVPPKAGAAGAGTTGNGINYNGGPVMLGTTNVYYIWYGNWSGANASGVTLLTNFAQNIGGSPYFNINTTYFDASNTNVTNSVAYSGSTNDNYSAGTSLSDASIASIVSTALTGGKLPTDPKGVYFVLTSADVNETSGFCTKYCGWHTAGNINGADIKYAFVGNSDRCPSACAAQSPGPNGTTGPDGMASVIAHELEESVTDPDLNAWYDSRGYENADKCAWTFGTTYGASNGAQANMKLGGLDYLIQQNWVNASGGFCALSYGSTSNPDFALSVSPSSQSVAPGGTTGNYGISVIPSNGFASGVTLSTSGLPAGATAAFSTNPATTTSNLTVTAPASLAAGSYPFTITGISGSLTHTAAATLVVNTVGSFTITLAPPTLAIHRGTQGSYTVTVTPSGGFNSNVQLSVSGLPSRTSASFSTNPVTGGSGTSTLQISPSSRASLGTHTITVKGTSGTLSATGTATLTIN